MDMLVDSVASTWSYCVGFPTWMLVTMPYDILQVCKTGVFDILNLLFVCSLLYFSHAFGMQRRFACVYWIQKSD